MTEAQRTTNPFEDPSLIESYENWYETVGARADCLEKELLKWLIGHFEDPISILEVGCGTGHFTCWFESLDLEAIGLDLSRGMLREARRRGVRPLVQGDAATLPFGGQSFDLVALVTTLEFLHEPLRSIHEATRVAKKGLLLGVINRWSGVGRQYNRQGDRPWRSARFFSPSDLIQMLETIENHAYKPFWRTTLWRFIPWALPLPWGGFIGMGIKLKA